MPRKIPKCRDVINKLCILGENERCGDPFADHISQERVRQLDFSVVWSSNGTDQREGLLHPLQHLVKQLEVNALEDLIYRRLNLGPGLVEGLKAELLIQIQIPFILAMHTGCIMASVCQIGVGGGWL